MKRFLDGVCRLLLLVTMMGIAIAFIVMLFHACSMLLR